jgi:hypothetical protein
MFTASNPTDEIALLAALVLDTAALGGIFDGRVRAGRAGSYRTMHAPGTSSERAIDVPPLPAIVD